MSTGAIAVIILLAIVVIAAAVALAGAARRRQLQQQFGPEHDRVGQQDSQLRADAEPAERQPQVRKLNISPLPDAARRRHLAEWQAIQKQFVDSPESAVTEAYALVTTVMRERGYPTDDNEQVQAGLPVDYARTVGNFRSAQAITREAAHGSVATEDMRQALIQYRELFSDLLGDPADGTRGKHARPAEDSDSLPDPGEQSPDRAPKR